MKVQVKIGQDFAQTNMAILREAATPNNLQPVFVLVPDRFTLQAERLLLAQNPHLVNVRVVTFSMLYQIVASERKQGAAPDPVLDKTSAVLYLWLAIRAVAPKLQWFQKSVSHYDFAEKMFNTLNAIRSSCVDFAALPAQVTSQVAQKKYHDINLIYQKYQEIITGQIDSAGMLTYLAKELGECVLIQQAKVYVCGFESLSPARLQVLAALGRTAQSVTIAAGTTELAKQLAAYPHQTIPTKTVLAPEHTAYCETPRQEALIITGKVIELLNQGVQPEDITILLTEFTTTAPVWSVVFEQQKIPVNLDVGQKLSETAEAKYLRDLLALAQNDNSENTVAVLFNQHSGIPDTVAGTLENTILAKNQRARQIPEITKLPATKEIPGLCVALQALVTQPKLQQILATIATAPVCRELNLRDFAALFWTLCSATKVSNIPLYRDRILIADVTEWVPTATKYLFIANCTAENFPQGQSDDDLLQEADLVGTRITPTPRLQRERNHRHAGVLGTVAQVARYYSGTNELFQPVPFQPQTDFAIYMDEQPIKHARELYFPKGRVSTTLLERFYSCPYLNFVQNGLKLQPRPLYRLQSSNLGSAIHVALQDYFTHYDLERAVQAGLQTITYDLPPVLENLAREMRYVITKLQEMFQASELQPLFLEKQVSRPLPGGLTLVGRIDRVDARQTPSGTKLIFILDYKTGTPPGSIAKSIYLGTKLQLPVYGQIMAQNSILAGAGYLSLPGGFGEGGKEIALHGFVDQDCRTCYSPVLLKPTARQYFMSDTIQKICAYANELVDQAVVHLLAGETTALAAEETTCLYCPVNFACPHAGKGTLGKMVDVTFEQKPPKKKNDEKYVPRENVVAAKHPRWAQPPTATVALTFNRLTQEDESC